MVRHLSGGMKRKLMICRALMTEPQILLLDEPTAGMDAISRRQMWNLLRQLHAEGITILLTTHYIEEAQSLCERIALINKGSLNTIDTPANLIEELGRYTVDETAEETLHSSHFHSKEEAIEYLRGSDKEASMRNTTLEDVFIYRIGISYMGIIAVLWEKWREFRRDFYKITLAATITPLMYLIVFGLGIQTTSHGEPYLNFLVPGIVAMSTMTGSFSAVAQNMSVQRLYEKALDQVMVSPTPLWQFILGQVIGGSLRGMYAACIILLITMPIAADLTFNGWSFLVMFLNGLVFSTIALVLSFLAKSYTDAPRFTSYIIMPMSFLCNTFFSTEQMPMGIRQFVELLPLSQACEMIRSVSAGGTTGVFGWIVLLVYLAVFSAISVAFVYKKKNL